MEAAGAIVVPRMISKTLFGYDLVLEQCWSYLDSFQIKVQPTWFHALVVFTVVM